MVHYTYVLTQFLLSLSLYIWLTALQIHRKQSEEQCQIKNSANQIPLNQLLLKPLKITSLVIALL